MLADCIAQNDLSINNVNALTIKSSCQSANDETFLSRLQCACPPVGWPVSLAVSPQSPTMRALLVFCLPALHVPWGVLPRWDFSLAPCFLDSLTDLWPQKLPAAVGFALNGNRIV